MAKSMGYGKFLPPPIFRNRLTDFDVT